LTFHEVSSAILLLLLLLFILLLLLTRERQFEERMGVILMRFKVLRARPMDT
jgi:hypothetical protein